MSDAPPMLPDDEHQPTWNQLATIVRSFMRAWQADKTAPQLADYVPNHPAGLRLLALAELIKVDLRQRWQRRLGKTVEQYLQEFPDLATGDELPCDVLFEEYQVRRQAGDLVETADYLQRFPRQVEALRRIFAESLHTVSSALVPVQRTDDLTAGQRIDDFDLLVKLGEGAFASVFLARQISMQRLVALKVSADRGQEPQTLAQLDHPHIVRVYDLRQLADRPLRLLYMQYVNGGTLQDVVAQVRQTPPARRSGKVLLAAIDLTLAKHGESPCESAQRKSLAAATWPEVVCWLGSKLADALDYAHRQGVLHRDVKPANVLLTGEGSPKLADFNVSFSSKVEGATAAAYMGGSLAYMSPEQLEACDPADARAKGDLDGRSDQFSLAVMLWELLIGRRPFPDLPVDGTWTETLRGAARQRRAGVSTEIVQAFPDDAPPGMCEILLTCLAPQRSRRPSHAGQLARQLELCMQPRVQSLLRPRKRSWITRARQHPLLAVCIAGLIPNLICSTLNITYNFREIISYLDSPAALSTFYWQLAIINPIAFGLGIIATLIYASPILSGVTGTEELSLQETYELQQRTLRLGDVVAWVSGTEWIVSGVVFPVWLHLEVGESLGLQWRHYSHFLVSQILCGLLAATQSFFLLTLLEVRSFFPALVRPDQDSDAPVEWLSGLLSRASTMFYCAASMPFLAVFAVAIAEVRESIPFVVLAGVGLASFAASYRLFGFIQHDVETLAVAVNPASDTAPISSSKTRSFLRH